MTALAEPTTELRHHAAELEVDLTEKRAGDGTMRITGTAVVYDEPSPRGHLPYREIIRPGALRSALSDPQSDVLLVWSHDLGVPLARQSAGNLQVRDSARGLTFDANLPNTTAARDAYELVRSRIVAGCSFAFVPDHDQETVSKRDGETWIEVHGVKRLVELTLGALPVYPQTSVEARSQVLEAVRRERIVVRDRGPYGSGSSHSYFRDLARRQIAREEKLALRGTSPLLEGWAPRDHEMFRRNDGDTLELAEERLASVEKRAVTSGDPWSPTAVGSGYIQGEFATAVRARAVLASALTQVELERGAMSVYVPRLTGGASTSTGVDNASVTAADASSAEARSPVVTISGEVDASQQIVDQTPGGDFDRAVSQDLGLALGANLETQVINGTGATGQLAGLLGRSGISTVSLIATTLAGTFSAIGNIDQTLQTALGEPADLLCMHPRRREYIRVLSLNGAMEWDDDLTLLESVAIPTNLGGGTEDRILNIASKYVLLVSRQPEIRVLTEVLSGTLGVRFQTVQYVALVVAKPQAIGVISGAGLAAPVFP